MVKPTLASLLALAGLASAQKQGMWGQCGGNNWSGPFECVDGATCQFVNDWYSQCLPGADPTTTTSTSSSTSTRPTTTVSSSTSTSTKPVPTNTSFPSVSGTRFTIDGETKYVAGTNCYWCSFLTHTPDVDLVFDHIVSSGLKVLRIWGFNDVNSDPGSGTVWFQLLSSSGSRINTGANGLQRLDYAVRAAEERGLKLIINFVNYWDDYGGMKAYTRAFGGTQATWYTNSAAQAQYRKYIEAVVARYKDSPAILAWELANEPRCQGCDTSVIYNWAKETSEFVKRLDPNHLVTLGDEGFGLPGDSSYPYGYSEGLDWVKNLDIPTLDFATLHMYPSHWGTSWDWGNKWIADHAAICAQKNKPCFLEEYGSTPEHCAIESEWQATSLAAKGMAGDAFWQFGDTTSGGKAHDDGFTIYYGTDEWKCLVTDHVANINSDEC